MCVRLVIKMFILPIITLLAACNGGSGGSPSADDPQVAVQNPPNNASRALSGAASAGTKQIPVESTVEMRALDGRIRTAAVRANGQFTFPDVSVDGPFLIRIDTGDGQLLYAIVPETGSADISRNLHAYSDFAARNWFSTHGMNIDEQFDSADVIRALPSEAEFSDLSKEIEGIVTGVLTAYELDEVDLMVTPFVTDDTFIDRFLRANPLVVDSNAVTLTIKDPVSMIESTLLGRNASRLTVNSVLTDSTDNAPQAPANLRILATGNAGIVALWDPAVDDRGVAEYRVFRDDMQIGTTPFPVFYDTSLDADTQYSYTIEAVDSTGQDSGRSISVSAHTALLPDTVAPPIPSSVSVIAANRIVTLDWVQMQIGDVVLFQITRSVAGENSIRTVTSTTFDDLAVLPGLQYCYTIAAIDGAGNRSSNSPAACARTPESELNNSSAPMPDELTDPQYLLADCGSIPTSSTLFSGDIDQPAVFEVGTIVQGQINPSLSTSVANFWDINLSPDGYHILLDTITNDGAVRNIGTTADFLDAFGVEQQRLFRLNEIGRRNRASAYMVVDTTTRTRLQIGTRFNRGENYTLGIFANGMAVPSPYFTDCPSVIVLAPRVSQTLELNGRNSPGSDAFALITNPSAAYQLTVDATRVDGRRSNIIYSIDSVDQFAQSSRETQIGRINDIGINSRFSEMQSPV